MSYTNPPIPEGSVQYFSNARGVYYLPSLKSEWEKSGYFPRLEAANAAALYLAGLLDSKTTATYDDIVYTGSGIFTGANSASIWMFYNERDHEDSILKLKKLGINCVRTPLNFEAYSQDPSRFLDNVKSFLNVCSKHKIRVQFIVWDAEYNPATSFSSTAIYQEKTDWTQSDLDRELAIEHPRNPYLARVGSWGGVGSFVQASAIPYLQALARSVSSYDSMWCFDLCNKPEMPTYKNLVLSSHNTLNQNLSSIDIKYTVSFKNGINIFNDTGYLDNGKGTGASGSYEIRDIQEFSGIIDFVSVPFIANNDYAFKRYLNGAISGASESAISKPFMVYAAYDPELGQNFNTTMSLLDSSSVGSFNDVGMVENVFSFGKSRIKNGNVYWDGEVKDSTVASSIIEKANNTGWFTRNQITKPSNLKQKGDDPNYQSNGFFSGVPDFARVYKDDTFTAINEKGWRFLKDCYTDPGSNLEALMSRVKEGSKTFRAPFNSQYADYDEYSILASSLYRNTVEDNLAILYDFDSYFKPLSSYTFSVSGSDWQKINETMILRNEYLESIAKFVADFNSSAVGYAELRNTQYDTNPIPHYERSELQYLVEVMTNPYRYVNRNPTTDKLSDLSSTRAWEFSPGVYGVSDSGDDFFSYYNDYYQKYVAQLKKCLMWIYREGQTNPDLKIVSDSFLDEISFTASSLSAVEIYGTTLHSQGDYNAGSLDSVKSIDYKVEVYNPESESWVSSFVFQASGPGLERQLVGAQATGTYASLSAYWCPSGSNPNMSFTTIGLSGLAKIRISDVYNESTGGFPASTTVHVFPSRSNKTRNFTFNPTYNSFDGEVYIGDKLWLEFKNDDRSVSSPLFIFADPFKPPIPAGIQYYEGENRLNHLAISGSQTVPDLTSNTNAYNTINWGSPGNPTVFSSLQPGTYFGPGIHYVSAGLPISSNSTYYIDANAYIIGGFDCASGLNSKFIGRGVISTGELYPRSFFEDAKSAIYEEVPTFYGPFGASWSSMNQFAVEYRYNLPNITVEGITVTNHGFWASGRKIIKSFNHCKALVPLTFNTDGFKPSNSHEGGTKSIRNTIMVCGDDQLSNWAGKFDNEVENLNIVLGSMRTGCFFSFVPNGITEYHSMNRDIDIYCYAAPSPWPNQSINSFSRNAIFMWYTPQVSSLPYGVGHKNGTFEAIHVEGGDGHPVYHPIFRCGNIVRPTDGTQIPPVGFIDNVKITNVNIIPSAIEASSLQMSSCIVGLSAGPLPGQVAAQLYNRPQNWTVTNLRINQSPETFLTSDNVDDWVAWYEPLSGTNSVTDPDSVDGSSAGIVFKTT